MCVCSSSKQVRDKSCSLEPELSLNQAVDVLTSSPSFKAPSALVKTALLLLSAAPCACPCNLDAAAPKKAGLPSAEQL